MSKFNKGEFTVVPSKSARAGLRPTLQVVYMWLADHSNDAMKSWPSRTTLAEECGISVRALDAALNELIELKFIEKEQRVVNNEKTSSIYTVNIVNSRAKSAPPSAKSAHRTTTHITQSITTTKVVGATPSLLAPLPKQTYGNPDVAEVLNEFEKKFEFKLSRVVMQRRAASNLVKKYGKDVVLQGIGAAVACSDDQYAPQIASLEDLQEKWNKLILYYRKKNKSNKSNVVDLSDM